MTETKYGPWKIGRWDEVVPDECYGFTVLDDDTFAYREVIEPKRETMVLYAKFYGGTWGIGTSNAMRCHDDNIRLHVPLIDGEPDFDTPIKWERV